MDECESNPPHEGFMESNDPADEGNVEGTQYESTDTENDRVSIPIVNNGLEGAGQTHMAQEWAEVSVGPLLADDSIIGTMETSDGDATKPLEMHDNPELNNSNQTDEPPQQIQSIFNIESLSYELQVGYRILNNLMSAGNRCVNKLFMYKVDDSFPETADYYEKIKNPMWMYKSKIFL